MTRRALTVVALGVWSLAVAGASAQAPVGQPAPNGGQTPPAQTTGSTPKDPVSPPVAATPSAAAATPPATATATVTPPAGYVIGADDILSIVFWRDKDMSADVVVRPDGRITLPLLNDVQAVGLTPEQLRDAIKQQAAKFIEDPNVTVGVKQINSRKVFVTGQVAKPGAYPLSNPTTVLQLLSMAGGVAEFADQKKIMVMRTEGGVQKALRFNYKDVVQGKNLKQNVLLQPGDTVVVP